MELSANFASNLRQRFRQKTFSNGYFLYPYGYYLSIDNTISFPLWTTIAKMFVGSLARLRKTNGFPIYRLFNSNSMPKTHGIKASVKYSSTTFTLSHETAKNQFSINPTLLQMLYHASKLFLLAETHFKHLKSLKVSHDVEQHIICETADTAGEIINQIGSVIGLDIAEQGFNLK